MKNIWKSNPFLEISKKNTANLIKVPSKIDVDEIMF